MPGSDSSTPEVLITGASGFVGGHLLAELLRRGVAREAIACSAFGADAVADFRQIPLNIADHSSIRAVVREVRPRAIIHLAALANPQSARTDPGASWAANFEGVRVLGEALLTYTPETRLIFPGSSEAYGASFRNAPAPLTEDAALRPMNAYAATKAAADIALGQLAYEGLNVVRFRPFNHAGPGQAPNYVLASFAQSIARIEAGQQAPVLEVGDLEAERDFLDVRDVVRAYTDALHLPAASNPDYVFNLASGQPRKLRAVLDELLAKSTHAVDIKIDAARLRKNDITRTWGDASRAAALLNWRPEVPFTHTLGDILTDWRARVRV